MDEKIMNIRKIIKNIVNIQTYYPKDGMIIWLIFGHNFNV